MFYEDYEEEGGSGVGAFVIGALIGAGVALLLAPRSGRETRDQLALQARSLRSAAELRWRDVQSSLNDSIQGMRRRTPPPGSPVSETAHHSHGEMERRARDAMNRPPAMPPDPTRGRIELDDSDDDFGV